MSTTFQGLRGTGQFSVDFRPKNYRELYTLLEPNGSAPLNALLAMTNSESTDDPEYKNFRDELPTRTMFTGAAATNVATTITLTSTDGNKYAIANALVLNIRTGEIVRVTADTTGTTLTVTRGVGQAGAGVAMNSGDELVVIGFSAPEGGTTPTPLSFDADVVSNYTQIFKTAFSVTGTQEKTYLRTGNKLQESMTKALKMHMSDIERAMFFGRKEESGGTTATPTRTTGGLIYTLSNVIDVTPGLDGGAAGVMTEAQFDERLITNVFAWGSKQKVAFGGPKAVSLLQRIAKNRWQPTDVGGTYGVSVNGYKTYAGDLMVHLHPQFRQITGMSNTLVIVDFQYLKYRYMEGRDTQLLQNRQNNNEDRTLHEYMTECGLELLQDKPHTLVKGWNAIA